MNTRLTFAVRLQKQLKRLRALEIQACYTAFEKHFKYQQKLYFVFHC